MSNVRPVTRLVTAGLTSLPWARSSISLGRPYDPRYLRSIQSHERPHRQRAIATASAVQETFGSLSEGADEENWQSMVVSNQPQTRPNASRDTGQGQFRTRGRDKIILNSAAPVVRSAPLASSSDIARSYQYDAQVRREEEALKGRSLNEVYAVLRAAASEGSSSSIYTVQACLHHMSRESDEGPRPLLYASFILANCRTEGSVDMVYKLLDEMDAEGYELDVGACHDILKVLSVHPDYILRGEVLQYMQEHWFELSDSGWHDVVASLIKDRSLEIALDKLEEMRSRGITPLPWLYDLVLYALAEEQHFDEALAVLHRRADNGDMAISETLWYYLLDVSSRNSHYDLSTYIWRYRVQPGYLNPNSGTCTAMLSLAAKYGEIELAQDIFRFLGERDAVYERQHYEMMIEAFIAGKAPQNGLHVLSAMHEAGVEPDLGTAKQLSKWLTTEPTNIQPAFDELRAIKATGSSVPVAAMNALIEAATKHRDIFLAIDLYKAIPEVCSGLADSETYHNLLRMCRKHKRQDLALKLMEEMIMTGSDPSALTYDLLTDVCIKCGDSDTAVQYYVEMRAKGFDLRVATAGHLIYLLTKEGNQAVWRVLDDILKAYPAISPGPLRSLIEDHLGTGEDPPQKIKWLVNAENNPVFLMR